MRGKENRGLVRESRAPQGLKSGLGSGHGGLGRVDWKLIFSCSVAISFLPMRNDPEKTTGKFYLSIAHIKAYRKRDEPEVVYVSDAGVGRYW